jgi:hypothetical protein
MLMVKGILHDIKINDFFRIFSCDLVGVHKVSHEERTIQGSSEFWKCLSGS